MKLSFCLIFLYAFFAELAIVVAQDNDQGKVIVHSDPRLLLLKKPRKSESATADQASRKHSGVLVAMNRTGRAVADPESPAANPAVGAVKTNSAIPGPEKTIDAAPAPEKDPATEKGTGNLAEPAPAPEPVVSEPKILHPTPWPVHKNAGPALTGPGYRVQIYNGSERKKALEIKTDFQLRYPTTRSYLLYIAPSFRVRVGNFRNRGDAAVLLKQLKPTYSPIMIVPDKILIGGL